MVALLFWFGVIGLVFDWRYIRKGGLRPSAKDKNMLGLTVALCVGAVMILGLMGGNVGALGSTVALLMAVVVALWSLRRFLVRRANPLSR